MEKAEEPNSCKKSPVVLKFLGTFLCVGLAFRLLSSPSHSLFEYQTRPASGPPPQHPLASPSCNRRSELFDGEWVRNPRGPAYTNRSCHIIESHQNCMRNGRPDSEYLGWRWTPRGCQLPEFDAHRFLVQMRNKSWAFIGDSISRNHVQSLVCILSQVEAAVEIYHDAAYKSKSWSFPTYNLTLSVIWSPYLIKADIFEDDNGVSTSETLLHLDQIDPVWMTQYKGFDYVVVAGGKWFLKPAIYYENDTIKGCHHCTNSSVPLQLGFVYAYRKALQLVFRFITNNSTATSVLFRTTTPDHFENGEWDTGGTCVRKLPFRQGEAQMSDVDTRMRDVELEEFFKAADVASERGIALELLDTTRLSLLRPDGHPGPYRQFHPFAKDREAKVQNDCLHWCLPGPIDSWNDLLMEMIRS